MKINFNLEKQELHFFLAFRKIVGNILRVDNFSCKDNIEDSTELLLLQNIDFELSRNNKLVVNMKLSHLS